MKKIFHIILLFHAVLASASAQSIEKMVIAAGGKGLTAGNVKLDFTVGETFINTMSQVNNSITQGFHQPNLYVARIADPEDTTVVFSDDITETLSEQPVIANNFKVEVFPNPATDHINIRMNELNNLKCFMFLSDTSGKLIEIKQLSQSESRIEFSTLPNGNYLVTVKSEDGLINESFKIIKVN